MMPVDCMHKLHSLWKQVRILELENTRVVVKHNTLRQVCFFPCCMLKVYFFPERYSIAKEASLTPHYPVLTRPQTHIRTSNSGQIETTTVKTMQTPCRNSRNSRVGGSWLGLDLSLYAMPLLLIGSWRSRAVWR